jgi:hypothetical protein
MVNPPSSAFRAAERQDGEPRRPIQRCGGGQTGHAAVAELTGFQGKCLKIKGQLRFTPPSGRKPNCCR